MHKHDHSFFMAADGENLTIEVLSPVEAKAKYGMEPENENGAGFRLVEAAVRQFSESENAKITWQFLTSDYMAALYTLGVAVSIAHLDPIEASEAVARFSKVYFGD